MNVTLGKELEAIVKNQVKTGMYIDASDAIRDAVRRTFCPSLDLDQDTPELAELIRKGINSPSKPWKKGDSIRHLEKIRQQLGK